jgi:hypothetical protein
MDTSIYTGPVLQLLPHMVNVRVDAPLSQKMMREYHLKFAYCLDDIRFKPFNVINIQLAGAYISKEMTGLCECISYPLWQQIMKS